MNLQNRSYSCCNVCMEVPERIFEDFNQAERGILPRCISFLPSVYYIVYIFHLKGTLKQ